MVAHAVMQLIIETVKSQSLNKINDESMINFVSLL